MVGSAALAGAFLVALAYAVAARVVWYWVRHVPRSDRCWVALGWPLWAALVAALLALAALALCAEPALLAYRRRLRRRPHR